MCIRDRHYTPPPQHLLCTCLLARQSWRARPGARCPRAWSATPKAPGPGLRELADGPEQGPWK
eukprot:14389190-Alexandrium_andersonii.AAC.1